MKKNISLLAAVLLILVIFSCKKEDSNSNTVVIFTSTEDFRTEHIQELLKQQFPKYDITVQVLSTGNHAAKIKAEGQDTEADIILNLETGHLESVKDVLADLSAYNVSDFLDELVPAHHKYLPWDKSSGAVVINREKLTALGLPVPASYEDLLKSEYKGLISMPNPKSSGTGYMFLVSLINAWGEDKAFAYFDSLSENILQFTTSGSGPVNALIQGEVAIGLGMTLTATQAINSRGVPLEMLFFAEGAPSITTGMGIIKGKENRPVVKEVFNFVMTKLVKDDKELYCPEAIFKNQPNNIPNYPKNIPYADMTGVYDTVLKERLLEKWKY
ncbi:MAG: extracellular solute-binding protein [Spirochaetaceae bacterium]|jgi:iron(III) transport system substrate-binding protein|nr:extracellular solute-binding protein [Spirochaetaceae bacterium]